MKPSKRIHKAAATHRPSESQHLARPAAARVGQCAPVVLLVASGEIWLTLEDVRALTGWTDRHVRRAAVQEAWITRASEVRGRNGKFEREYALSSLPSRLIWHWFNSYQKREKRNG